MKYGKARELIAEARKTFAQRSASLIGRMGGSPEEVRQGITGKRTPAAKGGRALLNKAYKAAEKKRERDPDYPYGKAETRRMSKYMSEAQLDELTDAEMEKLEREHEARMAEQERTAYKSPTMRYHLARLRKLAKPAAKKQTKDKRR